MCPRISSTSSIKPISSIRSTSSRITCFTLVKSSFFLSTISFNRPGVATSISQPLRILFSWSSYFFPPYIVTIDKSLTIDWKSSEICLVNSRVGAKTSTRGERPRINLIDVSFWSNSTIGRAKANVFPVPFDAWIKQSFSS